MKIKVDETFNRCLAKLTNQEAKQITAKIKLLEKDPYHSSLRVKKMKGKPGRRGIYRMRVTKSLRVTFRIESDTIFLRKVGGHDETILNP